MNFDMLLDVDERFTNELYTKLSLVYTFGTASLYQVINPHKYDVKDETRCYTRLKDKKGWGDDKENQENADRLKSLLNKVSVHPIEVDSVKKLPSVKEMISQNKVYDCVLREGQIRLYRSIIEAQGDTPLEIDPRYCRLIEREGFTFVESIFINAIFMPSRSRALTTLNKPLVTKKDFVRAENWFIKVSDAVFSEKVLEAIVYNWLYAYDDIISEYYNKKYEQYMMTFCFDPQRREQKSFYHALKKWQDDYEEQYKKCYERVYAKTIEGHSSLKDAADALIDKTKIDPGADPQQVLYDFFKKESEIETLKVMRIPKRHRWKAVDLQNQSYLSIEQEDTEIAARYDLNRIDYAVNERSHISEMIANEILYGILQSFDCCGFDDIVGSIDKIRMRAAEAFEGEQYDFIREVYTEFIINDILGFTAKMVMYIILAIKEACNMLSVLPEAVVSNEDNMFAYLQKLHRQKMLNNK